MVHWLFRMRDECIVDAFEGVSHRRHRFTFLSITALSLVVFLLLVAGQIQTDEDHFVLQKVMLLPTLFVFLLFYYRVFRSHPEVLRVLFSLPKTSLLEFVLFLSASVLFALIVRSTTMIWSGTIDLSAVLIAPLGEELLYRFALLYALKALSNRWVALVVSALLFGAVHAITLPAFLATVAVGLLLSFFVMRYGSLIPSYLFHVIFNATAYIT